MMHSLENRFIAVVCACMLLFVLPIVVTFVTLTSGEMARRQASNLDILLTSNERALSVPLFRRDAPAVEAIARSLERHSLVGRVWISDTAGKTTFAMPKELPRSIAKDPMLNRMIFYTDEAGRQHTVGTLRVWVVRGTIIGALHKDELIYLTVLIVSLAIVCASAIVSNRIMIIRPLLRLTSAIELTRKLGSRHHVDWQSDDEIGHLAQNFNEMQSRLESEENELKRAHALTTEIYNRTPAMLFTLDEDNRIRAVSNYWLQATGYTRDAVLDRPFEDFIDDDSKEAYKARFSVGCHGDTAAFDICAVTVAFCKADGTQMTALILDTRVERGKGIALSVMTDITELKQAESRNRRQAITDHLTGLLNRQGFEGMLDASISEANRDETQLACIFIDLDRFKWINDNFGHAAGDEVLRQVVARTRSTLRPQDAMARLGGDEFAILVAAEDVEAVAADIGHRICVHLQQAIPVDGVELSVSASVGIAFYPKDATTAAELLLKSDMAMYSRKRDGKNGMQLFDVSMLEDARQRREIEQHIEMGLKEDWIDVYLQPIVDLSDGRIVGFEALMRLTHPEKGVMQPSRIIEIAEETGTIGQIGDRVLRKAIEHLSLISAMEGTQNTYLAVNFSALQFEPSLPSKLASLLLKHDIAPQRIVVEITEAVLMVDNPEVHTVLQQLNQFGCRIALDDFGTGYSSLSYLNRFPVDIVKIDQSFTRSLCTGAADGRRKSRMLIKGIRTISHQMGCTVIAEGIETHEQWELLRKLGLDYGQGYLFSKPLAIKDMMTMLEVESEAKVMQTGT